MSRRGRLKLLLASLACTLGCAGPATAYKFPERKYEPGEYAPDVADQSGLLWGENTASVFEDNRSRRLGDLLIVRVEEAANASDTASTQTSSESTADAGINNLLGIVEHWADKHPYVDKAALISAVMRNSYKGSGQTKRNGSLSATIPVQVKQVMPNGDLFVEGGKTIQINQEETHLYLSGVVRPFDIDMDNTVSSNRVLEARIDFSGRGVVSDKQGPGLLHRGMDAVWPF
ncbi:MAG: flagellar basal body L-ring protein FlgH [Myxococcales bacterium FL481]|nr:MAG: flagellar basal body L-ring protein FlgH [Myxococcales bacterium FL481]